MFVILTWCICYSLMHSDCLPYHAMPSNYNEAKIFGEEI